MNRPRDPEGLVQVCGEVLVQINCSKPQPEKEVDRAALHNASFSDQSEFHKNHQYPLQYYLNEMATGRASSEPLDTDGRVQRHRVQPTGTGQRLNQDIVATAAVNQLTDPIGRAMEDCTLKVVKSCANVTTIKLESHLDRQCKPVLKVEKVTYRESHYDWGRRSV